MNQTQPSPDADDDWDAKATEALEAARLMPAGKEKEERSPETGRLVAQGNRHTQTISGEEARRAAEAHLTGCKGSACDGK